MGTFAAVGVSASILVPAGYTWRYTLTGTWVQIITLEKKIGNVWREIRRYTGNASVVMSPDREGLRQEYRLHCLDRTSGTSTYAMDLLQDTSEGPIVDGEEDNITAHAGGTQALAFALSPLVSEHRIATCATAGDSVKLPPWVVNARHFIRNDGAAAAQLYGDGLSTINGVATATGVSIPAGQAAIVVAISSGKWSALVGAAPFAGSANPTLSDADGNTLGGTNAGDTITPASGANNTLFGKNAGTALTVGGSNAAFGKDALKSAVSMDHGVAIGMAALENATGSRNTAVGSYALNAAVAQVDCVSVGYYANGSATSGDGNTAIGSGAMISNISGALSVAVGKGALGSVVSDSHNTAVGWGSLNAYTSGKGTAVGRSAAASATSGIDGIVAVGYEALTSAVSGATLNTAIGYQALKASDGTGNTALGYQAALGLTSGTNNVAVGYLALGTEAVTGSYNVGVGSASLIGIVGGSKNVAIGQNALFELTSGSGNIGLGTYAGKGMGGSDSNTLFIGDNVNHASENAINTIKIASSAATKDTTGPVMTTRLTITDRVFTSVKATAPADGDVTNSTISFWVDESGHTLNCKLKYAAGTVKTFTVPIPLS